jgi:hypothetical protein
MARMVEETGEKMRKEEMKRQEAAEEAAGW